MDERKATDILLDLESKVDSLLAYYKVIDFNLKMILTKLQMQKIESNQNIELPKVSENVGTVEAFIPETKGKKAKTIKSTVPPPTQPPIPSAATPAISSVSAPPEEVFPEQDEGLKKAVVKSGKKVAVQQKIMYPNGKNMILAEIKITTSSGELIKTTRTDSSGKWKAVLVPGQYIVNIASRILQDQPKIEKSYAFEVPVQDEILELDPIKG